MAHGRDGVMDSNGTRSKLLVALLASALLLIAILAGSALADKGKPLGSGPETLTPAWAMSDVLREELDDPDPLIPSGAQPDADAADRLPRRDLDRSEAADLLTAVFGEVIKQPSGIYGDFEVEKFNSDFVAVVEGRNGQPSLLSSTLPLRDEDADGVKAPVDLALGYDEGTLQPKNPLVEAEIPAALGEGILLSEEGVTISVAGAPPDRAPSNLEGSAAFYPNVAPDSDFIALPTPTGLETSTVLRSPDAPTTQRFNLTMPAGARLEETSDGGAEVKGTNRTLVRVRPPTAIDAEGDAVAATLKVSGDSLIVQATPRAGDAFPILVDPIYESYSWLSTNSHAGLYEDWTPGSGNEALIKPTWIGVWNQTMHLGMNLRSYYGAIVPNTWGTWNYYVPRFFSDFDDPAIHERPTTFIRGMTLSQVYFLVEEGAPVHAQPIAFALLWDENRGQFVSLGAHNSAEGQYNGVTIPVPNPGEYTDVKSGGIGLATSEAASYPRQYFVGQATVELSDKDSPAFGNLGSVSGWVNGQPGSAINYTVSDPGLGVYALQVQQPNAAGGATQGSIWASCFGNAASPCSRTLKSTDLPLSYAPSTMPQGENWLKVTATDPIGHKSSVGEARVKVDHTNPALVLSGTATEQATLGTKLPTYALNYAATDGDSASPEALSAVGSVGTGPGQMQRPMGVAVDSAQNIWVVDRENNRVQKFDKNGVFQTQFGSTGSGNGQFNDPRGLAVSPKTGNIWVSEFAGNRVQEFKPTGEFVRKITKTGVLDLVDPVGVAVGPDGTVWVADATRKIVARFNEQGQFLGSAVGTASWATGSTDLVAPSGVAVDSFGNAWVTDITLNRVTEYSNEDGKWLSQFGSTGSSDGQLSQPSHIAVAPSGGILVSDGLNNRIQEFRTDGSFMRKFGSLGSGSGQVNEARGLAVTTSGVVLVADAGNKRIDRWAHGDLNPQSGVASTEIKLDGQLVEPKHAPGCTSKDCAINKEWTLNADDYSVGPHSLEVTTTDEVGLATSKSIPIETHGDRRDPTVALSGSMTEQATLGTTLPSYTISVNATDPGLTTERQSGVASIKILVDGSLKKWVSPGCPAGSCSLSTQWTLSSPAYEAKSHSVDIVVIDGAGRSTTKPLTISIAKDTTPPTITAANAFYNAPEGWVEQKIYASNATGFDAGGYGITSMTLKIDGQVVKSSTQSCPEGGCSLPLGAGATIDMGAYEGGAHSAELRAEDGAGNVARSTWTINVDPQGVIDADEAIATLEALDSTSPVNTVGEPASEAAYEGSGPELSFEESGNSLAAAGSAAPTQLSVEDPGEIVVEVPTPSSYVDCPSRPAEEAEGELTGVEEEDLATTVGCQESTENPAEPPLVPVVIDPVTNVSGESLIVTPGDSAAVAENVSPHVDLVTRPLFDGAMTFTAIRDSAGAEAFSWNVELEDEQQLEVINSTTVAVRYVTGQTAFSIIAAPAHDAVGTTVPTSLSVNGSTLTLTVSHRGSSFVYPVVGGAGWEGGFQTYQITMPAPEVEGGLSEGEFTGEGEYRETTIGPPEYAGNEFHPLSATDLPDKRRSYNFHECRLNINGYAGQDGDAGRKREGIRRCHGEATGVYGEYYTIRWAVSVHGSYFYEPPNYVWIKKVPECLKWGPSQPAKVGCLPGGGAIGEVFEKKLDVLGHYRFAPGKWIPNSAPLSAQCFRINGVLPARWVAQEGGGAVLEDTLHTYKSVINQGDPCDWGDLSKLF